MCDALLQEWYFDTSLTALHFERSRHFVRRHRIALREWQIEIGVALLNHTGTLAEGTPVLYAIVLEAILARVHELEAEQDRELQTARQRQVRWEAVQGNGHAPAQELEAEQERQVQHPAREPSLTAWQRLMLD